MVIIILCVLWFSRLIWLPWMYTYLDQSDAPAQADFIIALSGGTNRVPSAFSLYQQGLASNIIVSGCHKEFPRSLEYYSSNGVNTDEVSLIKCSGSTWNEAREVYKILRANNATSVLIVTNGFHIRRAKATYQHLQDDSSIKLIFVAASVDYSADNWWKSKDSRNAVLREYFTIFYYCLRYRVCLG